MRPAPVRVIVISAIVDLPEATRRPLVSKILE